MNDLITTTFLSIFVAAFLVGIVVGLTGMGGGALMTPALIFLGVGHTSAIVTADLVASAVSKTGGAFVYMRTGSAHMEITKWLVIGSVPSAFIGPYAISWIVDPEDLDTALKVAIGCALLLAAATYAARLYQNLRRVRAGGDAHDPEPTVRPAATLLVGVLGGLLVGITSVGAGSVIMIALLTLYPGLHATKLVGTDMVQGIPLVMAAAISNIALHGLEWDLVIPLILGSVPATILGSRLAPRVPQSIIRRAIVVVLTMSAVALLQKAHQGPFATYDNPMLVVAVGLAMVVLLPVVWGVLRKQQGLPMFGAPYVYELEYGRRSRMRSPEKLPENSEEPAEPRTQQPPHAK